MKKNLIRALSMAMALCLSLSVMSIASAASNEVTTSGGAATSNVTLSSTEDGTLGGAPAATAMSVTVPTVLPLAVGPDGTVSTADNCVITNNSYGAIKVSSVTINAEGGWHLAPYAMNMAAAKVDAKLLGFAIAIGGGAQQATDNSSDSSQTLLTNAIDGCRLTGAGDPTGNTATVVYDAVVSPVSSAVTDTGVASVVFVVEWDT